MKTRLSAVVCDLGGVIVPAPFDAFAALEQRSGAAAGAIREINMRNPDGNAWARIERGEITVDEFVDLFTDEAHAAGHRVPARDVIDLVYRLSPTVEVSDPAIIQSLALCRERGLALALITNNMCPLGGDPEATWLLDLFDTVIESCVVGVRKPEPEIYRLALGALGATPQESVMLDDLGINLRTARSLGMTTIKVQRPAMAAWELMSLLD